MEHEGHRERLRQRYKKSGLAGFMPHEVLELLLTYAIPRIDTKPLANQLIDSFGSLGAVLEASPAELQQVEGIGPSAATLISMLVPLMQLYEQEKLLPRHRLKVYADLAAYCRTLYLGVNVERFYVLCLDTKLTLLSSVLISQGTPSEVSVQPRVILQELVRQNATGAVISHNHPSGSLQPSQEDIDITLEIQKVLNAAGIRLYDHVLISGSRDYSFNAHHLLDGSGAAPLTDREEELLLAAERPIGAVSGKTQKRFFREVEEEWEES